MTKSLVLLMLLMLLMLNGSDIIGNLEVLQWGSLRTAWRDSLKGQPESVLRHLVTCLGKCHIGGTAWAAWAAWAAWKKMHDKENWVNTYVFKHPHFGNRTSNHAESSHASLKHVLGTSSGKLKTVTMKVVKWYEALVDDRKRRLTMECFGESTTIVFDKINSSRLNDICHKVYRFAMDHIKLKLAKSIISEKLTKECECLINYNYLLPCYHQLAHITKISTITPQLAYKLERVTQILTNAQSKQQQIHFEEYINKIIELDSKQKLENLNGPTVVEAIKGRPKNTKRKMIALEYCPEAEKEETIKKTKTEKKQKKFNSFDFFRFSRHELSLEKQQKAFKKIINLGSPCDYTLLTNLTIAPHQISQIFSPEADGNCGYRAIAMEVYQNQKRWPEVKDKMLENYLKYQHTHYQGRMEHGHMPASTNPLIISLQDKRSPLPQQHWFGTIDHSQLLANAYNRTVAVYWNTSRETGDCLFVPFITTPDRFEPIILILDINHFLLAKRKPTRNFNWRQINPFHKAIAVQAVQAVETAQAAQAVPPI
ncbi:hypothetical protein PHYBLDRAFT_172691 [Phycomyces blakesleeanus NRRL 1555(-)]|uniref:OTU domain-containing protein n=1 Tax=Phycomyces blakesleeanus (strain ATCC 8743b / DSM 1359 / FGSC 10004 / NBRC 33097 / NRRL 1555) TaxID=763407 RepID=A0A162TIC9_PHYB8|nr:hypothetical protein PHYBLDRAFT_172691 [Phycomyces blakesleeanus NRRL 1555(-)]OAD68832.1 hypothetical protein PHYBLDRAFT_172691 [Phycomyces blakesleeanus NRRL 1555(-)]|eukprot:XP_018286872.1 hypothetical protein PHYBLDRAFT_172691 [Phycomyces blakesleeanus NRRL 1555(-)]